MCFTLQLQHAANSEPSTSAGLKRKRDAQESPSTTYVVDEPQPKSNKMATSKTPADTIVSGQCNNEVEQEIVATDSSIEGHTPVVKIVMPEPPQPSVFDINICHESDSELVSFSVVKRSDSSALATDEK